MSEPNPPGAEPPPVCLHVCVTCQQNRPLAEGEVAPGRRLFEALARALASSPEPAPFALRESRCLASCERGCAAAISAPGKWSTLLGHLDPDGGAEDLVRYGRAYAASATGAVMPSRRPPSMARAVLGRMPSLVPDPNPDPNPDPIPVTENAA